MQTALLEPTAETPSLELMPRADAKAILNGYLAKAEALRHTAETLTVTAIEDTAGQTLARNTRLSLRAIRIETEKRRVAMVEDMTKETRRINAAAKAVKDFIEPLEERLLEQEQFVDREKERLLNERRAARLAELVPFLTSQPPADVGLMEPDVYASFLADAKDLHALKMKREQEAEEARQAQEKAAAEERERMRLENERLKAEAEVREAEARKEREAAAAKQREIEAAAAVERAAAAEALRKEREAREAAERKEREADAGRKAAEALVEVGRPASFVKPAAQYTLDQKISCLSREIGMRKRVYPRQVEQGQMMQEKANLEIGVMEEILAEYQAQKRAAEPDMFDQH